MIPIELVVADQPVVVFTIIGLVIAAMCLLILWRAYRGAR